jgi:RNA polymerase sigma factor (sigma-70 family)
MDQLTKEHMKIARRVTRAQARRWKVPGQEYEDILQEVLARLVRYPPKKVVSNDQGATFGKLVRMNANWVLLDMHGLRHGKNQYKTEKARVAGLQATRSVGLYQPNPEGEAHLLDERILPSMASAEDVYMASVPSAREERLWRAIQDLPEFQREVVTDQFYEELSVAASASRLGVTEGEIASARTAAMRKLKRQLNPRGKSA